MEFEKTELRDSPAIREAFKVSYEAFSESMDATLKGHLLTEEEREGIYGFLGFEDKDDMFSQSVVRMAELTSSTSVSDDAVAAAMMYGVAKKDPTVLVELDKGVADLVVQLLKWDQKFEKALLESIDKIGSQLLGLDDLDVDEENDLGSDFDGLGLDVKALFSEISGPLEQLSDEHKTLLKAACVVGSDSMEKLLTGLETDLASMTERDVTMSLMKEFCKVADQDVPSVRSDELDKKLQETIHRLSCDYG